MMDRRNGLRAAKAWARRGAQALAVAGAVVALVAVPAQAADIALSEDGSTLLLPLFDVIVP